MGNFGGHYSAYHKSSEKAFHRGRRDPMRWEVELCRQDVKGCPGGGNRMYKGPAMGVGSVCRAPARKPAWLGQDEGRGE